jgi:methylmalonyl-CoA mutase N-terminal domain/subunit
MLLGVTGDQVLPLDVYNDIKARTLSQVRGTVQADILKEDQAQNTCIFSTEFALRLMGDVQEYFIKKNVRNFYFNIRVSLLRQEQIQLHNWLSHFQTGSLMWNTI